VIDEYSFLSPTYSCPFTYAGHTFTSVEDMARSLCSSDTLCTKLQEEVSKQSSGTVILEHLKRKLARAGPALRLVGIRHRFTQDPMRYRLASMPSWPHDIHIPELSALEQTLLQFMHEASKMLAIEMDSTSPPVVQLSLEELTEISLDGASELAIQVLDRIMPALGVHEYDLFIRETIVLGAWSLGDGHRLVCFFKRPKLTNTILSIGKVSTDRVQQVVDDIMSIKDHHFTCTVNKPRVHMRGASVQIMGCAGQFVFSELISMDVRVLSVNTGDTFMMYALFDAQGYATFYTPTGDTNLLLSRHMPSSKYTPGSCALDIYRTGVTQSYKIHITRYGSVSSSSDVEHIGLIFKTMKDGLNSMMTRVETRQVLETLMLLSTPGIF